MLWRDWTLLKGAAKRKAMSEHKISIRIYYEDTDFSGVVYHANYLKFFERGRSEALRALGISHRDLLAADPPLAFTARRIAVEFILPARIDDELEVRTLFAKASGARLAVSQSLWRGEEQLASAEVEIACIDMQGKPKRLPKALMTLLS